MGALFTAAVPRLRSPEEANLRAPGGGRLAARQLHQRRRRADRDEHLRREPAQARRALPRGRARADQLRRGEARPRGAGDVRPRRLHRRGDRADRRAGGLAGAPASSSPSRPPCSRAAASTSSCSRRSTTSTSSSTRSPPCAASRGCRSSRCSPSTRAPRRSPASPPREAAERLSALDVAAIGANHGAGLLAALDRARADAGRRARPRRAAEHRPREPVGRARHLPARDAGVLRRVRRARARARRAA